MPFGRVPGQGFDGSSDSEEDRQKHPPLRRKYVAQAVTGVLVILLPLAYASPPDPTWTSGLYDNADCDDVVGSWRMVRL